MKIEFEPLIWQLSNSYRYCLKQKMQALSEHEKIDKWDRKIEARKAFFFTEGIDEDYDLSCFIEDCVYEWTHMHTKSVEKDKCTFEYRDLGGNYFCSTKRLLPYVHQCFALVEGKKGYELVLTSGKGKVIHCIGEIGGYEPYYTVEVVMRRKDGQKQN